MRRDVYTEARKAGYKEGTEEFEGCAGIKKAIERHIEEGLSDNSDL